MLKVIRMNDTRVRQRSYEQKMTDRIENETKGLNVLSVTIIGKERDMVAFISYKDEE